jgi:hypothetical protein
VSVLVNGPCQSLPKDCFDHLPLSAQKAGSTPHPEPAVFLQKRRGGNSQAQRIRGSGPDRFLARWKDRKKEPVTQGVRALGPAVGLEGIDDVPGVGRGDRTAGLFCLL